MQHFITTFFSKIFFTFYIESVKLQLFAEHNILELNIIWIPEKHRRKNASRKEPD